MKKLNLLVVFITLVTTYAQATPVSITQTSDYKKYSQQIKQVGLTQAAVQIVAGQKKVMASNGGQGRQLDDYTTVFGITNDGAVLTQKIQLKIAKALKVVNVDRAKNSRKPISKKDFVAKMINLQLNMLCTYPATRASIDAGLVYENEVSDENLRYITTIQATRQICAKRD